ncbi:hypothetical protein [Marseilla massiliensis]|uniref:Uncharacterized protein n=1 Tax=Marseilla massiliensis TaxID=1841864 RepID=A0A938WVF6_9BACT|nr:hypothetical protein [Marseilla massiliensis]MBM6674928.1 hypothetical protein [Marseilla massiliensis]
MKTETVNSISSQEGLQEKREETNVVDETQARLATYVTPGEAATFTQEVKKICELSPKLFARVLTGLYLLDLLGAEQADEIIAGRLVMNRWPKPKAVNSMAVSIMEDGMQIMLLVIPGTVAVQMGYAVEDFEGNQIPEEQLARTVVIVDGQTRYMAIRKIMKEHPDKAPANVFAYFPTNWTDLTKMLQAINLKVFTWKNSDFITGVIGLDNIDEDVKVALKYVKTLEESGYNYTAACEFVTLHKGIIKKPGLVKAMSGTTDKLKFDDAKYGIEIHKAAQGKFAAKNEDVLMNKAVPEFVIDKWNGVCNDLIKKEAKAYMVAFFNSLSGDEIKEIVSPSGYKRGCGKSKAAFVTDLFNDAFDKFAANHPLEEFKGKAE